MFAERLTVNQQVYYNDTKRGWIRGVVRQIIKDKVQVENGESHELVTLPVRQVHGYIAESYDATDADLFHVSDLHVATLLYCIKDRFEQLHQQYSLMGEMVLSVNPFQVMAFNGPRERQKYLALQDPRALPPHIWQVGHKAFNAIFLHSQGNQSVVISGESGSGKTENTKSLIAYLGQISNLHSEHSNLRGTAEKIDASLTWSNPVMESFGNARTVRNDNSSRFGKYIKLYFEPSTGVMVGGQTVTYLLERSRIIMQSAGERNYHIFYEMLAGLSTQEKKQLGDLQPARHYRCLNGGNTFLRRGVDGNPLNDAEEFETVRRALAMIGVDAKTESCIFRVLAAILHLMEVDFEPDNNDKARIRTDKEFLQGCKLLQISPGALRECFLVKNRTSLVTILSTQTEAEGFRNAFCKALYVGLFDRLVEFVNKSIEPQVDCSKCRYIGLLDIFGFENFTRNSFEQLCINYANESLQNHYNKYTFLNDEEECKQEGIPIPKIDFPDNSECINMFDEKPTGIFSMLDEECHFKGGSAARFTMNLWEQWKGKNEYFVQPKSTIPNAFGLNHYAAFVEYNTDEWLEKNTDALKEDMYACIAASEDDFVKTLLATEKSEARRKQTVAIRFQRQLKDLREELESTETQFIRCIKPNSEASPRFLENLLVGTQLESAGVLQTIRLKRQGYPVRRPLSQFCHYFYLIMPRSTVRLYKQQQFSLACQDFLKSYQRLYQWGSPNYAVGKTKVFLRAEVWSALERLVLRRRAQLLARCRPLLIRWVAEYRERKRIEEERRRAEMKRLREIREAKAAACAAGLPQEKLEWAEYIAALFPDVPLDVVLDLVVEADTREEALTALLDMTAQQTDKQSIEPLVQLLTKAKVRREVRENLLDSDVKTISALAKLSQAQLSAFGCDSVELVAVTKALVDWQAQSSKCAKLSAALGSKKEATVARDVATAEATRHTQDFRLKLAQLIEMGYPAAEAELVLAHYNGDLERTVARFVYGGVNRQAMLRHAQKHKKYTTADTTVQRLIAMGASKPEVKKALRACNGDATRATEMLFTIK